MSNQPTHFETFKASTNSATSKIADTFTTPTDPTNPKHPDYDENKDKNNFAKDDHGNIHKKGDMKDKLNQAARVDKGEATDNDEGIVEKVMSYIPGLGSNERVEGGKTKETMGQDGPPNRPDHDVQVEQFLRKQYHSRSGDGMPDPDAKD